MQKTEYKFDKYCQLFSIIIQIGKITSKKPEHFTPRLQTSQF